MFRAFFTFFVILLFIVLCFWGLYTNGFLGRFFGGCVLLIGGLIFSAVLSEAKGNRGRDKQLNKWLEENDNRLIFFYATKKKNQEKIKKNILPLFEADVLEGYYEGPRIAGAFKEIDFLMNRIMYRNPKIRPHNPSIIKIIDGEFVIMDELNMLKDMDQLIDLDEVKKRIRRAAKFEPANTLPKEDGKK